ncbi:IS481 family transposase [Acidothermaceae bacterium B102]|nr:IS481 family transposase [Acidothermaceae bacterium B102]
MSHANAPLTVEGRRRFCERVDAGRPIAHVAAEIGLSRQCVSKWYSRWVEDGEDGLVDRSSQPHGSPRRTSAAVAARVAAVRRDRKLGADRIAAVLAEEGITISGSGVHNVLVRLGLNRLRDLDRPTGLPLRQRYERDAPGELIHVDVKKLGKIRPGGGWRAHGRGSAQDKVNHAARDKPGGRVGYDYVHVAVDDHTRLSYVEVLPDETGATCARFLTHAGEFFAGYGIAVQRVMSDNAFCYRRSTAFKAAVADLGAVQKFIKPHCPWTNGKAERFNQTLAYEWAYASAFDSSEHRSEALQQWLHGYNHHRPHASLGGHPPISRVSNVPSCDI